MFRVYARYDFVTASVDLYLQTSAGQVAIPSYATGRCSVRVVHNHTINTLSVYTNDPIVGPPNILAGTVGISASTADELYFEIDAFIEPNLSVLPPPATVSAKMAVADFRFAYTD